MDDIYILRMVVGILGAGMFLSLGGITLCAVAGVPTPEPLGYVAVGTFSAITGIIVQFKRINTSSEQRQGGG